MNKNPFTQVTVIKWKSSSEKETYIFTDDSMKSEQEGKVIKEIIFKDDTVEMAINKIAAFISKKDNVLFYAWKTKPVRFSIENEKWKGYDVNPFKSSDHTSKQLNEPITYTYHTNDLFNYSYINIVFADDLPKALQTNKYYFAGLKGQPFTYYKKQNELLTILKDTPSVVNILPEYYHRVSLQAFAKGIILSELFDKMHTSKTIDMIQWVDDTSRILYKMSKHNRIRKEHFLNFTSVNRIDKTNVVNLYSIFNKKSYCKVSIDQNGVATFNYILQQRDFIKWEDIDKNQKRIQDILQNYTKTKLTPKVVSLDMRIKLDVHNSVFKQLVKKLTENVFSLIKHDIVNQTVICVYKRSSNYNQNTDIYDHIKSRIQLGISAADIKQELENLGITSGFEQMIEGVMENMSKESELVKNNNLLIKNNGTIVVVKPYSTGYDITVTNCPNRTELHYLTYWISKIISTTINKKAKVVPIKQKSPSPKEKSPTSISSSESAPSVGSIDYDIDAWGGNIGGAPKKKSNQSKYLINMLRNADKDLFEENYARDKCQANKQPIVISKEMKENLEKTNQMHFDNIIEYGSREDMKNFYACPRLWCPESKVPLSPDVADAKCPIENEEPMQMYWDDDKDRKRYVKLIKPNEKGIYAPCCVKKKPDEKIASQKKEEIVENDNYIMNQAAPLPEGRYGSIPEFLHNVIFYNKNVKPEACKTTLNKSHSCFLRKGITKNSSDSYITSLYDILDCANKKELVKKIQKELDLLTFISLDDGNICKQFMNIRQLIPSDHPKLFKEYELFVKNKRNPLNNLKGTKMRIFNIFVAYKKYIEYIASNDFTMEKKPRYLYSLINILYNVNILICEKANDEVYFHCPSQVDSDLNPKVGIIMKEGKYYEPLEMKMRSTPGEKIFKLNDYPMLKDIVTKCKVPSDNTYNKIYAANNWIKSNSLNNSKKFHTNIVFINDDLTVDKMMTEGNILYKFDKIGISNLPKLLKDFQLKSDNVAFFGDYIGKQYNTVLNIDDIKKVVTKCKGFDVSCIIGTNKHTNDKEIYTTNVLTSDMMKVSDTLMSHQSFNQSLYNNTKEYNEESKNWYKLQRMVVKTIIKKYSDKELVDIHKLDRKTKVEKLMGLFKNIQNQDSIQIILEELPTDSVKSLKKWLSDHTVFTKYNLYDSGIQDNKEFIFSQTALFQNGELNIPDFLLSYHNALPNIRTTDIVDVTNVDITDKIEDTMRSTDDTIPTIFTGPLRSLPAKWNHHKKGIWSKMSYIESNYTKDTMRTFVEWLTVKLDIPSINYDDVIRSTRPMYFDILNNRDGMLKIWQDKSYFNEWLKVLNKRYKTPHILWDYFVKLSNSNKRSYVTQIVDSGVLFPNDFHLKSISSMLNISILVIHRTPYRTSDFTEIKGSNDDLASSSTFFGALSNFESKPLIILNKVDSKDQTHTCYYLVTNNSMSNNFYLKYSDAPEGVRIVVEKSKDNVV